MQGQKSSHKTAWRSYGGHSSSGGSDAKQGGSSLCSGSRQGQNNAHKKSLWQPLQSQRVVASWRCLKKLTKSFRSRHRRRNPPITKKPQCHISSTKQLQCKAPRIYLRRPDGEENAFSPKNYGAPNAVITLAAEDAQGLKVEQNNSYLSKDLGNHHGVILCLPVKITYIVYDANDSGNCFMSLG